MRTLFELLEKSPAVRKLEIIDFKHGEDYYYVRLIVGITDGSFLYVREYSTSMERMYSYHWQKDTGELLIRWDNAPHHPGITGYPHHRHEPFDVLSSSHERNVASVIAYIENVIEKHASG